MKLIKINCILLCFFTLIHSNAIGLPHISEDDRLWIRNNYENIKTLWRLPPFVYYSLIIELLQGEQHSVHKKLQNLSNTEKLYKNGQLFIKQIEKPGDN